VISPTYAPPVSGNSSLSPAHSGARFDPRLTSTDTVDTQVNTCLLWGVAEADVFRALADATRRAILDELVEREPQTLFELCTRLAAKHGLSSTRQAVSQHLDVLEQAGLVRSERRGRYKLHHLDTTPLSEIQRRWPIRKDGR
jgi:DNA-binding transcriptional ArsR family regulator